MPNDASAFQNVNSNATVGTVGTCSAKRAI